MEKNLSVITPSFCDYTTEGDGGVDLRRPTSYTTRTYIPQLRKLMDPMGPKIIGIISKCKF